MKIILAAIGLSFCSGAFAEFTQPLSRPTLVLEERDGIVAVEAEHFIQQSLTSKRAWHLTSALHLPQVEPDGDPAHHHGASGGAYLELLPDTRRTHDDPLIQGENFTAEPGRNAVLSYKVFFNETGRYYVWVRAFSTGTEDNGLHVGLNGQWPESGRRMQWCEGKNSWRWESKQRTEQEHCGVPHQIYLDVTTPGEHTVQFSMREDGFEFDKFILTTDRDFQRPADIGPEPRVRHGALPTLAKEQHDPNSEPTGIARISGECKTWHRVNLDFEGPNTSEASEPNPFLDYRVDVWFRHMPTGEERIVPRFFAADGSR